jgi:hypothetical protein
LKNFGHPQVLFLINTLNLYLTDLLLPFVFDVNCPFPSASTIFSATHYLLSYTFQSIGKALSNLLALGKTLITPEFSLLAYPWSFPEMSLTKPKSISPHLVPG